MTRLIGAISTVLVIFMLGVGTGGYFVGRYAYSAGAEAAFRRCLELSENKIEVYYESIPLRRFRCQTTLLLTHGLGID